MKQVDGATAVIDTANKTLTLFDNGPFQFGESDTIIKSSNIEFGTDYITVTGEKTRMKLVLDFEDEAYTREQHAKLGIYKQFDEFETGTVTLSSKTLKWPFYTTRTQEVCYIPNGYYGELKEKRKNVEVTLVKDEYAIFDYRTDEDDK